MLRTLEDTRKEVIEAIEKIREEAGDDMLISRKELLVYLLLEKRSTQRSLSSNEPWDDEWLGRLEGTINTLDDIISHVKDMKPLKLDESEEE